ncbi:MAG: serine/threonine protein kinase, partial [Candidatus Hydrothermarchaeales archaeon]
NLTPILYFEMEYVENKSLEELKKPIEVEKVAKIVFDIAEGMKYAHGKGIIHRDLKPQNVLLTKDSTPKISDWGLSKFLAESKTSTIVSFTPIYASPEHVSPKQFGKPDARSDIFQLGIIFYELVTGRLPFGGDSFAEVSYAIISEEPLRSSKINPEAKGVEKIIMCCLAKKKKERYQSAEELQKALADYLKSTYKKSLKKSSSKGDLTRSRHFCAELVMFSAVSGDYTEILKHLSALKDYAEAEEKAEIENLTRELEHRVDEKIKISEELMDRIKILAYKVKIR